MQIIKINPLNPDPAIINQTVDILKNNGIVIYPTDTTYGIGADATVSELHQKISQIKGRPADKPYSVIVADFKQAHQITIISNQQLQIINQNLNGAFTFILSAKPNLSHYLAMGIGIRIAPTPLLQSIVRKFNQPLITTSANLSGEENPYSFQALKNGILRFEENRKLINFVLDAGNLPQNFPSTVVDLRCSKPKILRQGSGTLRP